MALIGLDIGGTGAKAVAFDSHGEILSYAYEEYDMIQENPGWFEVDPNHIAQSAFRVLKECAEKCEDDVLGIGVSSFAESFVLLDENDRVLCNSLMYLDNRGQEYVDEFTKDRDMEQYRLSSGAYPRLIHSIFRLKVTQKEHPGVLEKVKKVHFIDSYILSLLGGGHYVDYGIASSTFAFDLIKKEWIPSSIRWAGLDVSKFPKPVPHGSKVGTLNKDAAQRLGLKEGIVLCIGGHDHIPSSLGSGIYQKDTAMNAIGTVEAMMVITDDKDILTNFPQKGYSLKNHFDPDNYAVMLSGNLTGGVILKWFRDNLGRLEKQIAADQGRSFYNEYEKMIPKEPTDLIVIPRFGAYKEDYANRGSIINLKLSTSAEEIYRAFMEGEAYEMYSSLNEYIKKPDYIIAVNGGANSSIYMQIRADVFNVEVRTIDCPQPGCLGDAMMAGILAGVFKDVDDAVKSCVKIKAVYTPDPKRHAYYMKQYDKYRRLSELLSEIK